MRHPSVGYDQAPAQVGDDDGPARVHGSGGDDGSGSSGGGSDCAFLLTLRGGAPASRVVDDFDMSEAALQKIVAANLVAATLVFVRAERKERAVADMLRAEKKKVELPLGHSRYVC